MQCLTPGTPRLRVSQLGIPHNPVLHRTLQGIITQLLKATLMLVQGQTKELPRLAPRDFSKAKCLSRTSLGSTLATRESSASSRHHPAKTLSLSCSVQPLERLAIFREIQLTLFKNLRSLVTQSKIEIASRLMNDVYIILKHLSFK